MNNPYLPSVSIIIPTLNEENYIRSAISSFTTSAYPNIESIYIVDGGSIDRTIEIVRSLSQQDSRIKFLRNPDKYQSHAINLALKYIKSDILLRADAHAEYGKKYVEKCVETLLNNRALNVGGSTRFVAKGNFQAGVALAAYSILGNGGAKHRNVQYNGYGETVFPGCFWRLALKDISGYDTSMLVNEDAELNIRLSKSNFDYDRIPFYQDRHFSKLDSLEPHDNSAVYINNEIKVYYFPRDTWYSLVRQYFKYGTGRYITAHKHSDKPQLRGKLPFIVISILLFLSILDILTPNLHIPSYELLALCVCVSLAESMRVNVQFIDTFEDIIWRGKKDRSPSFICRYFYSTIALVTMPLAHFSGYCYQLCKDKLPHGKIQQSVDSPPERLLVQSGVDVQQRFWYESPEKN
jgi:succinoglycan biosynthesis protein ExoA